MNRFQSSDLFSAFLVFVALFVMLVLLDWFYNSWISHDVEKPIYGRHYSLRFHIKRMIVRLLLKFGKRKEPFEVDKLQVFSDTDEMVRATESFFYFCSKKL